MYDNNWTDKIIAEAHAYVDDLRAAKGLLPWKWHRPEHHRIRGPLEDLLIVVQEEPMGKTKDISCFKKCGFVGNSPNEMHGHYVAYPEHSRHYVPTVQSKTRTVLRQAVRPFVRINSRPQSAFEQLHALKDSFAAEINAEEATISRMESEAAVRRTQLEQLRSTYKVLEAATAGPEPESSDLMGQVTEDTVLLRG